MNDRTDNYLKLVHKAGEEVFFFPSKDRLLAKSAWSRAVKARKDFGGSISIWRKNIGLPVADQIGPGW